MKLKFCKKRRIVYYLFFTVTICSNSEFTNAQLLFETSVQTPDASGLIYSIGDLNNDGFSDLYISTTVDQTGKSGNFWLNNGQGVFTKGQSIGLKEMTRRVAFADLDKDGDIDVFLANDATYSLNPDPAYLVGCPNEVWFNDGNGNFTNSGQLLGYEPSLDVRLFDVDNDGDIDAVVSNYHTNEAIQKFKPDEVWLNDGNGNFSLSQTLGYGMDIARLIDLNNDNFLDVLDKDTIWFNDGKGKFTKSSKKIGNSGRHTIVVGDLDGDADAFIATWNAPAEVWLNDGSNNFADSQQKLGNMQWNNIQLMDIDSDGDLDAFTDNYYAGPSKLWINQGGKQNGQAGTFVDSGLALPGGRGTLCDFNNDGKWDAIIGNKIWINEYTGTSAQEINNNNKISIFPNPTAGLVTLYFGTIQPQKANVKIYNLQGKKILSETFRSDEETIDLTGYLEGMYLVEVSADEKVYIRKICKQ